LIKQIKREETKSILEAFGILASSALSTSIKFLISIYRAYNEPKYISDPWSKVILSQEIPFK
jgi:hypothetical protein